LALVGLWGYKKVTATPLHPAASDVPSAVLAPPPPRWTAAVDQGRQIVRAGLAEQNLPGVSIAVGVGDDIVWAEGFGWIDLDTRATVAPGTRFPIGTASTPLTAAAVGLLLERGRLTLDDPIQKHVPAFPEKTSPVTLRHLMAHTSGVRNDGGDEGPLLSRHCEKTTDALDAFKDRPLLFEPGGDYRFSSYGWILVSAAVEAAANESFLSFMRTQVFEPLGMRDTEADAAGEPMADRATSYFPRFAADPRYGPDPMRPIDHSCYAGAAVFISTPSDLVRFGMGINSGRLLQPATVQLLQTPQRLVSGQETGYGLGWDVETAALAGKDTRWVGHEGTILGGMAASLVVFPADRIVVAVASNTSYADAEGLALKVAQAFAAQETAPARQ
jgi:CubicO group peptidase (beta-lactamase class C family)